MIPVRQSTAFETSIGPVLDADGVAVTNGVVGDFKIKKTSGNFAALNGSATLSHVSAGVYDLVLTTSDTDTVGVCVIAIDDTVNACQSLYLQVMEEAIYDALYAASANTFTGAAGSSKVTGVVLVDTLTTYTGNTPQTGDAYAKVDTEIASLQSDVTAIKAKTDNLPSDPADASDIAALIDALPTAAEIDTQLSGTHGGGSWGAGGSGSGAYTLTITVNDGSTALQNATVRMTEGVNSFTATTNASGVATFSLDAATYSVAITKDGYQFTPTTKVVSATGSQTYSMTAVTISASEPDKTTGYATTIDENGVAESGVIVSAELVSFAGSGIIFDEATRASTSNGSGVVQFTNMIKGATYAIWRGSNGLRKSVTIASDAAGTTALGNFGGRD